MSLMALAGEAAASQRAGSERRSRHKRIRSPRQTDKVLAAHLAVLVAGSALAVGTAHRTTLLIVALMALMGLGLTLRWRRWIAVPACIWATCLAAYQLLQACPLPLGLLRTLSPTAAETWERALLPFGETPAWGSLSVDPGATLVEALKWVTYAAVFGLGASVGQRRGGAFIAGVSFVSAALVAFVTLLHGAIDVKQVYGLYQPSFTPERWTTAPLLNPNNLAGYLNLGAFAGFGLLLSSRSRWPRWPVALGTSAILGQSLLTGSRGGAFSLLVGLVLLGVVLLRAGRRGSPATHIARWQLAAVVLGGAALGALGAQPATSEALLQEGMEKLSILFWSVPLVRDHLWFGVGGGAFETAFLPYRRLGGESVWTHPENFVVAWLSEWGVPVGGAALIAAVVLFRPRALGAANSRLTACLFIGVSVLCLQNLADHGLHLPSVGIAVATVLGGLWGAQKPDTPSSSRRPASRRPSGHAPRVRDRWLPRCILVGGAACLLLASTWGLQSAHDDRHAFAASYHAVDFTRPENRSAFFSSLRDAMRRHPGDAFLPRLGALAALRSPHGNPLPWVTRALERDPMSGRMHLLLAEILAQRGNLEQALLELRLAAERDPTLIGLLAERAVAWARDRSQLKRAVPSPRAGNDMLLALARRLSRANDIDAFWRRRLLQEALHRDQALSAAHAMLAEDLLDDLATDSCPQRELCFLQVDRHLAALRRGPTGSHVELEGYARAVRGEYEAAVAMLLDQCPRTDVDCLRRAVTLSSLRPNLPLDLASNAYLAAACSVPAICASARLWVGDLYAKRQLWGAALAHYTYAAEVTREPRAWLRVADVASRQGAHGQALDALRRTERLLPPDDTDLAQRLEAQRKSVIARMAEGSAPAPARVTP